MGVLKDFCVCRKCSTFVLNYGVPFNETNGKISYTCPECGARNSITIRNEQKKAETK